MAEEKKDDIILSIHGMCKSFGRNKVLDHINMDVKRGTIMGLMGENGAGKSTMMKCLFGTYQKDEGTIVLDGKEVNFTGPKDALENGIAMVHQDKNEGRGSRSLPQTRTYRQPYRSDEDHVGFQETDVRDCQGNLL